MSSGRPLKVALVGCGAIAEAAHAPALRTLVNAGRLTVAALVDPNSVRRRLVAALLPAARSLENIEDLAPGAIDLAIVASPVGFHAPQCLRLLADGVHVLVEKPIATNIAQAEQMVEAARASGRVLAVGLFRRFFPALGEIAHLIGAGTFGQLRRFDIFEGGPFTWPSATPAIFDPKLAGGGVLLDVGVHVLDVLLWWLGEPLRASYADDAAGGVEMNCRIELACAMPDTGNEIVGAVQLSRDWRTSNLWTLEFERATVCWRAGEANRLAIRAHDSHHWCMAELEYAGPEPRTKADSYAQTFTRQLVDVIESIEAKRRPRVDGAEALRSLRLITQCYRERKVWAAGVV